VRLCVVSAKYPFGPGEPFLDTELRALAPSFERVVVFPTSQRARAFGYDAVPASVLGISLFGPRTLALAWRALVRQPRAVASALAALLGGRYALRAKLKNLVVVPKGLALAELVREHGIAHVHAYWLSTPATVAWLAARVAGVPFSATTHRWDIYENNMAARKLHDATFVRTISARGRDDLLAMTGGEPAKAVLVRLGVALPATRAEAAAEGDVDAAVDGGTHAEPDGERPLRILCAARLVPVKGHDVLIRALVALRDDGVAFACTLAGDGELRDALQARIDAAGLGDRVRLAGAIPHDVLLAQLQAGAFDVSVIASIERAGGLMEGVPVALLEAMAAGAVVVATDSGSIGELVDATTGVLVPHSDATALASALARVARDPDLRSRLRAEARCRVEREYDGRRTSDRLRALILGVAPSGLGNSQNESDACLESACGADAAQG